MFLAIGNHSWGLGETKEQATKEARKYGGTGFPVGKGRKTAFSVYEFPNLPQKQENGFYNVFVDQFGGVHWPKDSEPVHVSGPNLLER